jgi:hypothetical protein
MCRKKGLRGLPFRTFGKHLCQLQSGPDRADQAGYWGSCAPKKVPLIDLSRIRVVTRRPKPMRGPFPVGTSINGHPIDHLRSFPKPGCKYRVFKPFPDFDGTSHPIGEEWNLIASLLLPDDTTNKYC